LDVAGIQYGKRGDIEVARSADARVAHVDGVCRGNQIDIARRDAGNGNENADATASSEPGEIGFDVAALGINQHTGGRSRLHGLGRSSAKTLTVCAFTCNVGEYAEHLTK